MDAKKVVTNIMDSGLGLVDSINHLSEKKVKWFVKIYNGGVNFITPWLTIIHRKLRGVNGFIKLMHATPI